jgi:hypothetical protein
MTEQELKEQEKYEKERLEYLSQEFTRVRTLYNLYQLDKRLASPLTMQASLDGVYWWDYTSEQRARRGELSVILNEEECKELVESTDRIHVLVKVFEGYPWYLGGIQEKVEKCDHRGLSGKGIGWSILIYCLAGRCLITLKDEKTQETLTLITADDEKPFSRQKWMIPGHLKGMGPMGIQGYDCTEETAKRLLTLAITSFPELETDDEVHLLGF